MHYKDVRIIYERQKEWWTGAASPRHSANQQVLHWTQTTFSPIRIIAGILRVSYTCSRFSAALIVDLTDTKRFVVIYIYIYIYDVFRIHIFII